MKLQPRTISPDNVDIGCTVTVDFPPARGLIMSYTGRVHSIRQRGYTRQYMTQEGAVLFATEPNLKAQYKISLLGRDPEPQTQFEGISFSC